MYQQQVLNEKSAHHCSIMTKIVFVPPDVEADQKSYDASNTIAGVDAAVRA
jgi:hypothetical protein